MKKCCWLYAGQRIAIYSASLIGKTIPELVNDFNTEYNKIDKADVVYFRQAILQSIEEKGVDVSVVEDCLSDLPLKVKYNEEERKLVIEK